MYSRSPCVPQHFSPTWDWCVPIIIDIFYINYLFYQISLKIIKYNNCVAGVQHRVIGVGLNTGNTVSRGNTSVSLPGGRGGQAARGPGPVWPGRWGGRRRWGRTLRRPPLCWGRSTWHPAAGRSPGDPGSRQINTHTLTHTQAWIKYHYQLLSLK